MQPSDWLVAGNCHITPTLVHLDIHSKPNPVIDIQPVKLVSPELTQPSIVLACVGDDTGRSTENTLQLIGRLLWCTDQETATVVDPAGDERLDEIKRKVFA